MKIAGRLICAALVFAAFTARSSDRLVDGFPELPRDARSVAERSVACMHFWGEANGTGDERDRQVSEQLRNLRCKDIEHDLEKVRRRYKDQPKILKVLLEATEGAG